MYRGTIKILHREASVNLGKTAVRDVAILQLAVTTEQTTAEDRKPASLKLLQPASRTTHELYDSRTVGVIEKGLLRTTVGPRRHRC